MKRFVLRTCGYVYKSYKLAEGVTILTCKREVFCVNLDGDTKQSIHVSG